MLLNILHISVKGKWRIKVTQNWGELNIPLVYAMNNNIIVEKLRFTGTICPTVGFLLQGDQICD